MISKEIREKFLHYFEAKKHAIIASSPVVPHDDPTLLFTNAGMNQFKDVFLGESAREYTRACSSQKCVRVGGKHNDLDNVGHTTRHMTFFEMLGNFSFGDYFKEEAIAFAWEVALHVFEFPKEKLWVSVFEEDEEAFQIWTKYIDPSRIARIGAKDNFWSMGDTGPCGPCSELFIDRGEKYGNATSPANDPDGERFLEFWNLVFMQYEQGKDGSRKPLAKQSIDTGAGLERVVMLKTGVDTVFATDILRAIIAEVEALSGHAYVPSSPLAPAFHVIADHIRTLSFAIADGAQPSNVDRGYVLRKLLRRAVRYGRKLGFAKPFLSNLVPTVVELMGETFPELLAAKTRIEEILDVEEEGFLRTLRRGGNMLQSIIDTSLAGSKKEITGHDAFTLKDTYGFPLEEILLLAKDNGLSVNLETYSLLEEEAKEKSRKAHVSHAQEVADTLYAEHAEKCGSTEFEGYTEIALKASVTGILKNGVQEEKLHAGESAILLLDTTPFYAEKGGQVGDHGIIEHENARFIVTNTTSPYPGTIAHEGTLESGILLRGEPVEARIDLARRVHIMRNHTATHLLHWALFEVLGEHIKQAGSLVEPDKLRFDFSHHKSLSQEKLWEIEAKVNAKILENARVTIEEISYTDAQKNPRIKQFFGDKYGSVVRLVCAGDFSHELCGGTHVGHLGEIGLFKIAKESSIAKGVRRIEAVTGHMAYKLAADHEMQLHTMSTILGVPFNKLESAFNHLVAETSALKAENKALIEKTLGYEAELLIKQGHMHGETRIIAKKIDLPQAHLGTLATLLATKDPSCAILLATEETEKCFLFVRIGDSLQQKGIAASALIKELSPLIQGGGGGKKDAAQAGGKRKEGIHEAITLFTTLITKSC